MGVYIKIVTHYVFKMLICLLFGTCAFCMESRIKSLMEMHTLNTAKTQQGILNMQPGKRKGTNTLIFEFIYKIRMSYYNYNNREKKYLLHLNLRQNQHGF